MICLHTVNWFQLLQSDANNSIQYKSCVCCQWSGYKYYYLALSQLYWFICTQSKFSKYCYIIPIIQFRYTVKEFQVLQFSTTESIQYYSFVWTQLNGSEYCYVSFVTLQKITIWEITKTEVEN